MKNNVIMRMCSFSLAFALFAACQNYPFEEVPTSVIRTKHKTYDAVVGNADILIIMDNSGSMVGEQTAIAQSFQVFKNGLDKKFGKGKYQIAVITTGMESVGMTTNACQACNDQRRYSCINQTGESGRFQDRLGHNTGTVEDPQFVFESDPSCKIMDSSNIEHCFYDQAKDQGVIFTGVNGCGYERGLASMRSALSEPLITTYNTTATKKFLRDNAVLAVVVISDEEDCGEVGDVTEGINGIKDDVCYYAANGQGPDGAYSDPKEGRLYKLEPLLNYYDFLMDLKGGRTGYVKFAAVTGMADESDPSSTQITFTSDAPDADKVPSCSTPDCQSDFGYCDAYPGTRYIDLAKMFGDNGFVGTICTNNFSDLLNRIVDFVGCPRYFNLSEKIVDPALANIFVNDVEIPRYSCSGSSNDNIEICAGPSDDTCTSGQCVKTWTYTSPDELDPPDPNAPGGKITFADHYNPCDLISEGVIHIDVVYAAQ